jgi:lysophospholipase L1-like esterase
MASIAPVLAAVTAAVSPVPAPAAGYAAVGDSLTSLGVTYTDRVAGALRQRRPSVRVLRAGCPGTTAAQMIRGGGPCRYEDGTQLQTAQAWLRARRGNVDLVTLTIGANDVQDCIAQADSSCLRGRLGQLRADVSKIARGLRTAAGPKALLVGTTYHDPYLGYWVQGRQEEARRSVDDVRLLNRELRAVYRAECFRVADIAREFEITGGAAAPRNVEVNCRLTLACPADPAKFDVHPNEAGYRQIGQLVLRARLQGRAVP